MTREDARFVNILQRPPTLGMSIWAYRLWIVAAMITAVLIALPFLLLRKTTYSSSALLLFPASPLSGLSSLTGGGRNDLPSIPLLNGVFLIPQPGTSPNTAILLLRSWSMQHDIIANEGFAQVWKLDNDEKTRERFNADLTLRVGKTGDLEIAFADQSPVRARRVVQTLIDKLEKTTQSLGLDPAARGYQFLEKQVAESQQKLLQAAKQLADFERSNVIIDPEKQASALAEAYVTLQRDLRQAKLEASLAMQRATMLSQKARALVNACLTPDATGLGGGRNDNLNALYQEVVTQESALVLLRNKFAPASQEVIDAEQGIAQAKRLLQQEVDRQLHLVNAGDAPLLSQTVIEAALKRSMVTANQAALDSLSQQMKSLPEKMVRYNTLLLEVTAQTEKVKLLREELEKARILAQSHRSAFVIVDPPRVPTKPNPTGRGQILLFAVLLGAGSVVLYCYFRWNRAVAAYEAMEYDIKTGAESPTNSLVSH